MRRNISNHSLEPHTSHLTPNTIFVLNLKPHTSHLTPWRALRHAFTLVEVLVVMMVIAILAGMLFPVVLKAKSWAREKQAMTEVKNIEMAIKAYHSVYAKWPNQTQPATDACYVVNNSNVIAALINNPRSLVFLHFQQSSISTNFAPGSYLDPWLHPYVIVMDDSGDNKVWMNTGNVTLTNLNGKVTVNSMTFTADFTVGIASWGNRDAALSVGQADYVDMDLCSWQLGRKTK